MIQESQNRKWERIGYNFAELEDELALKFLAVMKECPLKRLDITGNDFPKKVKKAYSQAIKEGVLSRFDDDEDEEDEVLRLFEEMRI